MTSRTKDYIFMLVVTAVAVGAALLLLRDINRLSRQEDQSAATIVKSSDKDLAVWQDFKNNNLEFAYPAELKVREEQGRVILNHNIPFENHGDCDMKGDTEIYPTLDDFNVSLEMVDKPLLATVKSISPYIPEENFTKDGIKVNPGFIDQYQVGDLSGFAIYEGAEGCGWTIYYFPIDGSHTLVIKKDMVQLLSGVISSDLVKQVLAVPGVISREESQRIFEKILASIKIRALASTPGWNIVSASTAYGEQYKFSVEYPPTWTLGESRGGKALSKGQCTILLGAGGHGMEGYSPPKVQETTIGGLKAIMQTWEELSSPNLYINTQVSEGGGDYIFDLIYPASETSCLADYKKILQTVKIGGSTGMYQDLSVWKTYRNEEYGFEFNYPPFFSDFKAVEKDDEGNVGYFNGDKGSIGLKIKANKLDPDNIESIYGPVDNPDLVKVGVQDGYQYLIGDAGCGQLENLTALRGYTLDIGFGWCEGEEMPVLYREKELINKILLTFKFIK